MKKSLITKLILLILWYGLLIMVNVLCIVFLNTRINFLNYIAIAIIATFCFFDIRRHIKWSKLLIIIGIILFTSCSSFDTVKLNDKNDPFIIGKIEHYQKGFSTYYGVHNKGTVGHNLANRAKIVLPSGMYNIGDTIIIKQHTRYIIIE